MYGDGIGRYIVFVVISGMVKNMVKIAGTLIVKDDGELVQLSNAVKSLRPYVDDIFITSNGKEVSMIKKFCKAQKLYYSHKDWTRSFSDARNYNFDQAVEHDNYDFIFWMDTDDLLVGGEYLREIAEEANHNKLDIVFLTYWYGCLFEGEPSLLTFKEVTLSHMRERLIRPGTHKWKSRLHETPVPMQGYEPKYGKHPYDLNQRKIAIMHTTDDNGLKDKMMRNKELLELQLDDEKKKGNADPRTLLYLMKIYGEIGTEELCKKSITFGKEYLSKSGWEQERGVCHEQMAIAYGKMGNDQEACTHLHQAIEEHPYQVLFYIRLAQAYFNLKKYKQCEHWMKVGSALQIDDKGGDQTNLKAIKVGYAELLLNLNWNIKRDVKKALESALMLYKEAPTPENHENALFIQDANDLNDACERTDKLCQYLASIGEEGRIPSLLKDLPMAITGQPFAIKMRQKYTEARKWGRKEICYFANFGGPFFEKWDAHNLEQGIGGSETAVIELSKEWAKDGWDVIVYGDPEKPHMDEFNILWLPWYYFNPKDSFNIFIQHRWWSLAGKIKARRFYVDLHDIVNNLDIEPEHIRNIDKVFFKSNAHRALLTKLPQDKVCIIGNGVRYAQS